MMFSKKRSITIFWIILLMIILGLFGKKAFNYFKQEFLAKNDIAISYSTDNNYIYPLVVSMHSVMKNSKPSKLYNFTILVTNDVTDENKEKIYSLQKEYNNCKIQIINMGEKFANSQESVWSKAMYYRLNLPELLPNVDKCIYLDCDTLIRHDISEMTKINMDDYYIAGVKDYNDRVLPDNNAHGERIGVPSLDSYICSGVLIMNLEKMRNDNMVAKLQDLVSENDRTSKFIFPDQDALNVACYGHILILPLKYGAMTYLNFNETYEQSVYAKWVYNQKEWDEARTDPTIVHYTFGKPWVTVASPLHQEWWNLVDSLNIKDEIYAKYKQ